MGTWSEATEEHIPHTEDELSEVVLTAKTFPFATFTGEVITLETTSEEGFTLQEIFDSVAAAELLTRSDSEWFGGIDTSHVYIENLSLSTCRTFFGCFWGS